MDVNWCILSFHMFSWFWLLMSTVDWCSEMMWDDVRCTFFRLHGFHCQGTAPPPGTSAVPKQGSWTVVFEACCVGIVQLSCSSCASADRVFHDVTSPFQFHSITRGCGNFSLDPSYPRELVYLCFPSKSLRLTYLWDGIAQDGAAAGAAVPECTEASPDGSKMI